MAGGRPSAPHDAGGGSGPRAVARGCASTSPGEEGRPRRSEGGGDSRATRPATPILPVTAGADPAAWRKEAVSLGWTPSPVLPHPLVARAKEVWQAMEKLEPEALAERFRVAREMPREIELPGIER